jgi:hypothetical protein
MAETLAAEKTHSELGGIDMVSPVSGTVGSQPTTQFDTAAAWQNALDAAKRKQGFTDGYNIVTYGSDNGARTVTDTTGNAQGPQAIVTFDRGTDTGTVTQIDPSTGKPMLGFNGKILQDTITENGPGGPLTVKGNLGNFDLSSDTAVGSPITVKGNQGNFEITQYGLPQYSDPRTDFTINANSAKAPVDISFGAFDIGEGSLFNPGGEYVNQLGVAVSTPSTAPASQGKATPQDELLLNTDNTSWSEEGRDGPNPADKSIISSTFYPAGDPASTTEYTSPRAPAPGFDWNPLSWF